MIGKTVLHYQIISKLGEGGMGVVYKAQDTKLRREVAIKFLPHQVAASEEEQTRFKVEAQAAAALNHANIATIHNIEEADGETFIVMEYIDGQELKKKIDSGPIPIDETLKLASQIALGLQTAHEKGVIHRDIKSANIMLTHKGEAKIMDFGLAKLGGRTQLTKEGTTLGTVAYMSPEQTRGDTVDHRSDIFSLGVLLFEMLTGQLPFKGDYDQAITYSILNEEPEPVTALRTGIPMALEHIISKAIKKDPAERYQRLDELLVDLKAVDAAPATEESPSPPRKTQISPLITGFIIVAALAIAGALYYWWPEQSANTSRSQDSVQRLAVLPFTNIREDPQTDFLGFALADQIIGSLSYLKNILVRPSTSIRQYQDQTQNASAAGAELQVDFILSGNYLKEANIIRLNIELVDVVTNEMIWREPIEVEYENAFALQDIVSEKIIDRLQLQFSQDERASMQSNVPQDPLAYEYYLRSLSYPEDAEGNRLAINMLRRSIELDSTFAPVWAARGRRSQLMAYWDLGGQGVANLAKDYFLKALELNPELLNTLMHLTMLYTDFGETNLAMETALQMLKINPNSAEGRFAYGYVLRYAGMNDEAVTAMARAIEIDPTNPTFKSAGYVFVIDGLYDEAISAFELASIAIRMNWGGEIAFRRGQFEEAREKWSQSIAADPEGIAGLSSTALLSALNQDYARGIEAARKWEAANLADGEGWYYLGAIYCINGDIDNGISALDTAVERGYFAYPHMLKCRFLDPAHGNPRLDAVLEKARIKHEAFKKKFF